MSHAVATASPPDADITARDTIRVRAEEVWENPDFAFKAIETTVLSSGLSVTQRTLRDDPGSFDVLLSSQLNFLTYLRKKGTFAAAVNAIVALLPTAWPNAKP